MESAQTNLLQFPGNHRTVNSPELESREDARLLSQIADGDHAALAMLYRRRSGMLYSLLIRMLMDEMEAQEILQDTFMIIWRRANEFQLERSSPLAWMIMIARGRGWDLLRARNRRKNRQVSYESEIISLEVEINAKPQIERDELAKACNSALNNLPEAQSQTLQLAFYRGWTHEEIANATGEPLGTIKARIRRGLLALRKTLKEYHG